MKVTKQVKINFGVSNMRYEIELPAGLRVKKITGEPMADPENPQYFLDSFPFVLFPVNSFIRHDAVHYGIRLDESQVQDV
jgi:hypothetical protein